MSVINYAIEINTGGNFNNSTIGHTSDGYFRWTTGRPNYDGTPTYPTWEDDSNNTHVWYEGIIIKNSLSNPSSQINIIKSGKYGTISSFSFKLENSNKIWNILLSQQVWLANKPIQVYAVIDNKFWYAWSGIISNDPYDEQSVNIQCSSNYRTIHKNFPDKQLTSVLYPKAKKEDIGKTMPVTLGNNNYAKMYGTNVEEDKAVLDEFRIIRNQDNSLDNNSILEQIRDNYLYAVPAKNYLADDPVSGKPYVNLINNGLHFRWPTEDQFKGQYLTVVYGPSSVLGKYYRIAGNDKRAYEEKTFKLYLEESIEELDDEAGNFFDTNYALNPAYPATEAVGDNTWWFSIVKGQSSYIISNKEIGSFKKGVYGNSLLYAWDSNQDRYKDFGHLLNNQYTDFQGKNIIKLLQADTEINFIIPVYSRSLFVLANNYVSTNQYEFEKTYNYPNDKDRSTKTSNLLSNVGVSYIAMGKQYDQNNPKPMDKFYLDVDFLNIDKDILANIENLYLGMDIEIVAQNYDHVSQPTELSTVGIGWQLSFYDFYGTEALGLKTAIGDGANQQWESTGTIGNPGQEETLQFNFMPNEFYRNGDDNNEESLFHRSFGADWVKNEMKLADELRDIISRKIIKWARLRLFTYQTTNNNDIRVNSIKVKQLGIFSRGSVNTEEKNFYVRVNQGEKYDGSTGTESVYNCFRHILENYDNISSADIDYGNLATTRNLDLKTNTGWDLGRQITKTKNSMLYLDELCKQSMVGMFQTRDNKIKLKAFNEDIYSPDDDYPQDDTVETFADDINILRDSEKTFAKTPLNQTYNEFFLQYGYNPASKEYDKELTITKSDQDSFPDFWESSEAGANVIISDTYTIEQIVMMTSGEATVSFTTDVSSAIEIGDTISLVGFNEGYSVLSNDQLQYGRCSSISEDGLELTIDQPTDWTESTKFRTVYNGGQVIKHISGSLPKWKTFTSGFSSYAEAKNFWEMCSESFKKSGVVRRAPTTLTNIKWYIDEAEWDDKRFFKGTQSSSSPYLFLKNLVEWTVYQKSTIKFSIPLNADYIVRDLLDFVLFKDILLTNDVLVPGWITKRSLNLKKNTIELTVTLRPILDELINIIQESGSAADVIEETGTAGTIIQES